MEMTGFIFKMALAVILGMVFWGLRKLGTRMMEGGNREQQAMGLMAKLGGKIAGFVGALLLVYALVSTSFVWTPAGHITTLNRVYIGKSLPPGRIVALPGELGPQAEILTPGFHMKPLITLLNRVENIPVVNVPPQHCALMSAKDGMPPAGGAAFAEPWSDDVKHRMANDAEFFLAEGKGQRGPQTTVLTPGLYTINPFLWEDPKIIPATRIEQGTVGVVKSSVKARVDFGVFRRGEPTSDELQVLNDLPEGRAKALLVPVGGIGVWEEPLPNGLYYINTDAYRVTHVPTIAQVYEYKGGYTRRTINVSVDATGRIKEEVAEKEVQEVPQSADTAIFVKPEGWDVAQELRVLAQISPRMAPFVVAALGLTGTADTAKIIEDRVVTPVMRSVTRDVIGGAQILIKQVRAILDEKGNAIVNPETGQPETELVQEFRPVKVLDLLENRPSLEEAIEGKAKPQADKEGVTIMEVLLAESAIPAELLIARKREQLAELLKKAWEEEEKAQVQRQATENARALADQQGDLVKAEILATAAESRKTARELDGEGEKSYLLSIAEGQKAQAEVLGEEQTVRLQMYREGLKAVTDLAEKNPEVLRAALENAHKFVPEVVVNNGAEGTSGGFEGAAAVLGRAIGATTTIPSASTTNNK